MGLFIAINYVVYITAASLLMSYKFYNSLSCDLFYDADKSHSLNRR